jgi:hypothetical protein
MTPFPSQQPPDFPGAGDRATELAVPEHTLDRRDQIGVGYRPNRGSLHL